MDDEDNEDDDDDIDDVKDDETTMKRKKNMNEKKLKMEEFINPTSPSGLGVLEILHSITTSSLQSPIYD